MPPRPGGTSGRPNPSRPSGGLPGEAERPCWPARQWEDPGPFIRAGAHPENQRVRGRAPQDTRPYRKHRQLSVMKAAVATPPPRDEPGVHSRSSEQSDHQQDDNSADRGVDYVADDTSADVDAEVGQQPARNQRADDAEDDIADQSETAAGYELACEPTGDCADDEKDDKGLNFYT